MFRWEGKRIVLVRGTALPPTACWMCGAREGVAAAWRPFTPWLEWLRFVAGLGSVIGFAASLARLLQHRERHRVGIRLCRGCSLRWHLPPWLVLATLVGGFFLMAGLVMLVARLTDSRPALQAAFLTGLALEWGGAFLVGVGSGRRFRARCVAAEDGMVTLAFPRPDLVQAALEGD